MKLGLVISTQPTSFSAISYDVNIADSFRKAAEMGYDGVELAVREPDLLDVALIKSLLRKYKLEVPAIGTGQMFVEEGLSFTEKNKSVRKKATARIKAHINLAEKLETNVIIGLARGRGDDKEIELNQKIVWMDAALNECAGFASGKNVALFIEPLNRYESTLVNTVEEGIKLIERLSRDNVKLLIDTFHMNIEEPSIYGGIIKSQPYLAHVHFADSDRHAPGAGHLDFAEIVNILKELGYDKYTSIEILPLPSADEAAGTSINHLQGILLRRRIPDRINRM